jgi:hypothetical protein
VGSTIGYLFRILGVGLLAFGLGFWPARALAGAEGIPALAIGVGISLLGALLGHLPVFFTKPGSAQLLPMALAGMGIRLLATLALAGAAFFLLQTPREPLGIGLVLAYLSLLALEVRGLIVLGGKDVHRPGDGTREEADGS